MAGGRIMIKTTIVGCREGIKSPIKTYMDRLDNHLESYYPSISWNLFDSQTKGLGLQGLAQDLQTKVLDYHPNIVFLYLSSKNMMVGEKDFMEMTAYEEALLAIVKKIKSNHNRTGLNGCIPIPVLITPPPVNEALVKEVSNSRLKQYCYIIKKAAEAVNGVFLDLYTTLDRKLNQTSYLDETGLYLNQKGEDLLYDLVFIELTKLIDYQGVIKERDD